jgi:transposase
MLEQSQPSPASQSPPPEKQKPAQGPRLKRGAQPGNQNARKQGAFSRQQPGPLSHIRQQAQELTHALHSGSTAPAEIHTAVEDLLAELDTHQLDERDTFPDLRLGLSIMKISMNAALALSLPAVAPKYLEKIALAPFGDFARWYKRAGISRDADSFFIVSEKSAQIAPLPPDHPHFATNLTDDQWSVLAPLIPPDPQIDYLCGQPPLIIAANRYGFTEYIPGNDFADCEVMEKYKRLLARSPALLAPPPANRRPRSRKYAPRALLDAILWKLATGHAWKDLSARFPPLRACQKYYRRLFLSGRFYTLILALYNHMRLEICVDPWTLLEADLFTTTPGQRIALAPEAAPTSENYTALLFMQLARTAWSAFEYDRKQKQPFYQVMPVFKGEARLSTARLPAAGTQPDQPSFQPLEESLSWQKTQASERQQKAISREVARRVPSEKPGDKL